MTTHASRTLVAAAVMAVFAGQGGLLAVAPACAAETVIDVTVSDGGLFEPSELHATFGMPFTLRFHNRSATAVEVESRDLRFEKVVVAGGDAIVKVRPVDAGTYEFFNDFKPEVKGHVVVGE